jgi:small-conductance mechanosensitive channel
MNGEYDHILVALWRDLHDPDVLWQAGVLAACLLLAWQLSRSVRMPEAEGAREGVWRLGMGGIKRVLLPALALVLVLSARPILAYWHNVNLLHIAVPLLASMVMVRVLVYALRYSFPHSSLLAGFEFFIGSLVWGVVVLHIIGVLPQVIAFLESISFAVGKQEVSAWLVLQAVFWIFIMLLASLWLASAVEARLMRAERLDASLRVVFARLSKALLMVLAVLIVLPLVGIDLTVLSVFGGALGVGLGLGLQKVASNYVSGFIILLDHSIRIGDYIDADGFYGKVQSITTRYVVLRGPDGREAIVPNEHLIASTVLSHTHSDRRLRLAVRIQVGYDTDIERALDILKETARAHDRVMENPGPSAFLVDFGENGINLELGFWIDDPESGKKNVRSEISRQILLAFRRENIEIPFPRRDIRVIAGSGKAPA